MQWHSSFSTSDTTKLTLSCICPAEDINLAVGRRRGSKPGTRGGRWPRCREISPRDRGGIKYVCFGRGRGGIKYKVDVFFRITCSEDALRQTPCKLLLAVRFYCADYQLLSSFSSVETLKIWNDGFYCSHLDEINLALTKLANLFSNTRTSSINVYLAVRRWHESSPATRKGNCAGWWQFRPRNSSRIVCIHTSIIQGSEICVSCQHTQSAGLKNA